MKEERGGVMYMGICLSNWNKSWQLMSGGYRGEWVKEKGGKNKRRAIRPEKK